MHKPQIFDKIRGLTSQERTAFLGKMRAMEKCDRPVGLRRAMILAEDGKWTGMQMAYSEA